MSWRSYCGKSGAGQRRENLPKGSPPLSGLLLKSENAIPVVLHAYDEPAILLCFIVERLGESADLAAGQWLSEASEFDTGLIAHITMTIDRLTLSVNDLTPSGEKGKSKRKGK